MALLDKVPMSVKRSRYQGNPTGASQPPMIAMHAVVHDTGEEWFNGEPLKSLGTLMSKKVLGVRTHAVPRRRLYDHEGHQGCNRLTLVLIKNGDVVARDDGVDRTSMKMSEEWVGLTIFYMDDMSISEEKCVRYAPVGG